MHRWEIDRYWYLILSFYCDNKLFAWIDLSNRYMVQPVQLGSKHMLFSTSIAHIKFFLPSYKFFGSSLHILILDILVSNIVCFGFCISSHILGTFWAMFLYCLAVIQCTQFYIGVDLLLHVLLVINWLINNRYDLLKKVNCKF